MFESKPIPDSPVSTSSSLSDYLQAMFERVRREIPLFADQLKQVHIASVTVQYDGCGDSGQINDLLCYNAAGEIVPLSRHPAISADQLLQAFYDLIEVRHPGWEINDGGSGQIRWDLVTGSLIHTHNDYFTDSYTTEHEGL